MNKERLQDYNERLSNNNVSLEEIKEKINELPTIPSATQLEIIPTKEEQSFSGLYDSVTVEPIPDNYIEPTGTLNITENGEYDVTDIKTVNTDIHEQTPYAPKYISFANYKGTDLNDELSNLDTKNMTSFFKMFQECRNLQTINSSHFDTSNITDMSYFCDYCQNLLEIDVSNFDTSNVTTMYRMFSECRKVQNLDVSNFDTSKVTSFYYMFYSCAKVPELDVSNFDTSKATSISGMFYQCNAIKNFNINHFDTSNVKEMANMFVYCTSLTDLDISNWDASKVYMVEYFASNCRSLVNVKFMKNLGKGYTQKSNNSYNTKLTFANCNNLTHESLMNIINNLYDLNLTYDVANGGTLYTQQFEMGSTNKAKLTAEEIAIATAKGWTVI